MEDMMTGLALLGVVGSFLLAGSMAWFVSPPAWREPPRGVSDERRRWGR
ncbi:MAG TPA: hypothetical protein VFS39_07105 [Nitrospira sp.]|nr:hypothetical protein [Nitrospira sp.]